MNPNDIKVGHLALAQCRAILGGSCDPFRAWWDGATVGQRKAMLLMVGMGDQSAWYSAIQWDAISDDLKVSIKTKARAVRAWLDRMPEGVAS
jgi:hypothetical protein